MNIQSLFNSFRKLSCRTTMFMGLMLDIGHGLIKYTAIKKHKMTQKNKLDSIFFADVPRVNHFYRATLLRSRML